MRESQSTQPLELRFRARLTEANPDLELVLA